MASNQRHIYLDHSASTPTDPRVVEAMLPYFTEGYGNSSAMHSFGRKAEQAIENAREIIARILNCDASEVVFTSGGSESDNFAIRGAAWAGRKLRGARHLITTPVEHEAIHNTVQQLVDDMDFEVTILPVDHTGGVNVDDFATALRDDTAIASVIYANNEVGTIAPIPQLAALAHERRVLFHTDAVQAAGQLSLNVQALSVDLMSLSAHKFYGPKGVGALYIRKGTELLSSQTGGSHESGRRAGTHNTPGIVGMATALELAYAEQDERISHFLQMRDTLIDGILSRVPDAELTGHAEHRLPSHASFVFAGIDSAKLLIHLDTKGIAASAGSACKTGNPEPSGVLLAMGYTPELATGSLRLTVGRQTTAEDVEYTVETVTTTIEKLRKLNRAFAL
jgi:cysteine desulfurase